jgi:subtilisin family serine protease
MSDTEMWEYIVRYDTLVNVGLKAPGTNRGIWRDRVLVSGAERATGRQAVSAIPGLQIVQEITGLPAVQVRVGNQMALAQLRALPFSDYVEPNALQGGYASENPGCSYNIVSPQSPTYTFAGDVMPPHYRRRDVQIDRAWQRATGEGVVLGLTDTGIASQQLHLLSQAQNALGRFAESHSSGRWNVYRGVGVLNWWETTCSHGTRMAATMAAPMNGAGMVGVAWNANLVSVHQADRVFFVSGAYAAEAIRIAAMEREQEHPNRRIITMAWQSNDSGVISDMIRQWYWQGRLFIAAAGTVDYPGIAFPADMIEVIAVSAVNPVTYGEIFGLNYGDQVELSFPVDQLSLGPQTQQFASLGGSSGASAVVSGIAALVWSKYPNESNLDIRQRLRQAAHNFPYHNRVVGFGVPNAMKAVGGMYDTSVNGCVGQTDCTQDLWISGCTNEQLTAHPMGGDGPFTYTWTDGSTSSSTTKTMCANPGSVQYYSIGNTVTDTSDGTSVSKQLTFRVIDMWNPPCGGEWIC